MTRVAKAITPYDQEMAFAVRRAVFVDEQQVDPTLEFDGFESNSVHYLATDDQGVPCGAARWRVTESGVKLERFAVLASHRRKKIGSALLERALEDIASDGEASCMRQYLHAQIDAVPLYAKYGFRPLGEVFIEADILHQQMEKLPEV